MCKYQHETLTKHIIGSFYNVYNELGFGFLEKVYENAMLVALTSSGLKAEKQYPISVLFEGHIVGEYLADIVVENKVIIEIKAIKQLSTEHEAQLLNYLKATNIEVGLLLNFGPKPEIMRRVFANTRK
jgi:GxxExxY protein